MSARTTRAVAILGAGMIGEVHRRAAILAGAQVAGVLASSPSRSHQVAQDWGCTAYASVEDVLADDRVEVVHVCTPNATHAPYTEAALRAGKHVVCEKPLGIDDGEAERMAALAAETGLVATVPFVYRYHPIVREIRDRRLAGEFGELNLLHGSYLQDWMLDPNASGWRVDSNLGGASRAFADIGSHWCDLVEWVSGEHISELLAELSIAVPTRPSGTAKSFGGPASGERVPVHTEDSAALLLRTAGGVLGSVTISQVAAGRKNRLWFEMDGANASAVFDQENPEYAWLGGPTENRVLMRDIGSGSPEHRRLSTLPAGHAQGYAQCFEAFVADTYAAIDGQTPVGLPTFTDGLRAARIVAAVLRSANTRAWTEVQQDPA